MKLQWEHAIESARAAQLVLEVAMRDQPDGPNDDQINILGNAAAGLIVTAVDTLCSIAVSLEKLANPPLDVKHETLAGPGI